MNEEEKKANGATLTGLKNLLWSLGIIICCAAVVIGLVFAMFRRDRGEKESFIPNLGTAEESSASEQENGNSVVPGVGVGNARGILNTLERTDDAGSKYIDSLTFLVDSTFISMRNLNLVSTNQVWATESGSMPMDSVHKAQIKFPNDGNNMLASSAAMTAKPEILVIGIGMDGLMKVDEETFIINYETLINDIRSASPDTKIICCGLSSVAPEYSGSDKITATDVSDGNDWVQLVCRDTGSYYLDIGEELCESVQLLSRFASSNKKTLNRDGINAFLSYVRTHAIQ